MILSAHNDVFGEIFRDLDKLKTGDQIIRFYEQPEQFTYSVTGTRDRGTHPDGSDAGTTDATVTLVSCYPYLVDNQRIVVKAGEINKCKERCMAEEVKRRVSGSSSASTGKQPIRRWFRRFSGTATTEFNPDYSAIKIGLKRIAILAASFISILVILSFFLKIVLKNLLSGATRK